MAQGFVKSINLIESSTGGSDRAILDNLGGPNISNDVLLFDGNTKFTSKLIATDYTVSNDIVYVNGPTSEGRVAFSDGTLLSHDGSAYQYTVRNSNGVDRFQLYTSGNVVFNPTGVLRRNDTVTGINLANLSVKRLNTNIGASTGISAGTGAADLFNSNVINSQVSYIGGQLALFYYKRGRVPLTYQDSTFSLPIKFNGSFRITNDANLDTQLITSPGLFIVDANNPGSAPVRAFSDSSNPWAVVSGGLQTTEVNAQCSILKLQPTSASTNINFDSTGNNHSIVETNAVGTYTHKLPVLVNGQQYFLLLKL
jgi:phage baseplate assembly protein gpV